MLICRISKTAIVNRPSRSRLIQENKPLFEIVVFSDALTLDSQGCCAQIHDRNTSQSKCLIVGKPRCGGEGKCSEPPHSSEAIRITEPGTLVEIVSRDLIVTEKARRFCQNHGVILTVLPALAA